MPQTISNQATLNFTSGTVNSSVLSNIAQITLEDPLGFSKDSFETAYRVDEPVTYTLYFTNPGTTPLTNVTITDNLGTFAGPGTTGQITPLTYTGPAKEYVNSVYTATLTPTVTANAVTFTIPTVPAGSNVMIQYKVTPNQFVPTTDITNTATITSTEYPVAVDATHVLPIASYTDVAVQKTMSPDPVVEGNPITYTFRISNSGNQPATNASLTDTFTPAPTALTMTVDGIATTDFTYTGGTLTYPTAGSTTPLTIPAATFTTDPVTGATTVTPSTVEIVVTGTMA